MQLRHISSKFLRAQCGALFRFGCLSASLYVAVAGAFLIAGTAVQAQEPEPIGDHPKYEFRAAWLATVANIDWPAFPGQSSEGAQADLESMIEQLHKAGINAVHFQVRPGADALYESDLEPWSYWVTGTQGQAPDPYWDPLEFAVEKAHERGMELHAWLNPYRAHDWSFEPSPDHITNTHPKWILEYGSGLKILDPGIPAVRDYVVSVFMDIASRYDVDGLHIDDYFYPYEGTTDEDSLSWADYGDLCDDPDWPDPECDRDDWRRWNTRKFIEMVQDSLQVHAPDVVWGASPFGIWKNGIPTGTNGLDAYNVIYIDGRKWIEENLLDYITPQLYWAFGGGQDYGLLSNWWEDRRNGRHFYPGQALYRSEFSNAEVPNQIRHNRSQSGIFGSTFFSAKHITSLNSNSITDSLKQNLYTNPSLTPIMEWRDMTAPPSPDIGYEWINDGDSLHIFAAWPIGSNLADLARVALYRIHEENPDIPTALQDGRNLLAVNGTGEFVDVPTESETPYTYVVTAVSSNSVESAPSDTVMVQGRAVSSGRDEVATNGFGLEAPAPNPFTRSTEVQFSLAQAGTVDLRVFDSIGREVALLVERKALASGTHTVEWQGSLASGDSVPAGVYFLVLEVDGKRATRGVTVVR